MKTSRLLRLLPATLALALGGMAALGSSGCSNVMVNKNTEGRVRLGELQIFVGHDFATAYPAAKAGMGDFGLFLTKDEHELVEAELRGRDPTDTLVFVDVEEVSANRTSIKVRYGFKGDVVQSQKLITAIQARL